MRLVGKTLQVLGLTIPPVSLLLQLGAIKLLAALVFSVCLFLIGGMVESLGKRQ